MILNDVMILDRIQVLNEGSGKGPMKIRGVFQRADEANKNKRIYPRDLLEREMNRLAESISGRSLLGELDHPAYDNVKLSNVSHLVTKLEMKGSEMIGEAEILSTPAGQVVRALIRDGVAVGISSRGSGSLSEDAAGNSYVNEDFKLTTFDLVADPSTRGAYPGLAESTRLIESLVTETCRKAVREKVFITMLKGKLNEWNSDGPLSKLPSTRSKARQETNKFIAASSRKRLGIKIPGEDDDETLANSSSGKAMAAYKAKKKGNTDFLDSLMSKKKKAKVTEGSLKDKVKRAARERSREGGMKGRIGGGSGSVGKTSDNIKKNLAHRISKKLVSYGNHGYKRNEIDPVSINTKERLLKNQAKNESATKTRRGESVKDQIRRRLLTSRINPNSKLNSSDNVRKEIERMRSINNRNK